MDETVLTNLKQLFGSRLKENAPVSAFCTAQTGGKADILLVVNSAAELREAALRLWQTSLPFRVLGAGSNLLIADQGYRGVVIINRAKAYQIHAEANPPYLWAESGANLGGLARQAAIQGLSGLEWAAPVPGTLGGAVYGNAGAHGGDMAGNLVLADILHPSGEMTQWNASQMAYQYRSSVLKRSAEKAVILSATLRLTPSTRQQVTALMTKNLEQRRRTQPPGASMGSMFKNPTGDYAGRLIEAAGLKGARVGGAQISPLHANFFVNTGSATAADIYQLIHQTRQAVQERFGVLLDLEIELLGDFEAVQS
ncbi:MAG: UDP-N-acetylmuramate dehydrogenase [Chloroflexi bacterium]|nr:UDP-N-acetylmuramate dehydrogenase [Chloroflexota bacterium]